MVKASQKAVEQITPAQELKDIARHRRWAMEELVFDQKMIELNKMASDGPWAERWEYRVERHKVKEALVIMRGGPLAMYRYLLEEYGSQQKVLKALRHIVCTQRGRAKTLSISELAG